MYYLETGGDKDTQFRYAILIAFAVHAVLILTISFKTSTPMSYLRPQIQITLAQQPSTESPQNARQIAQAHQEGNDDDVARTLASSRNNRALVESSQQSVVMQPPQSQVVQQQDILTFITEAVRQRSTAPKKTLESAIRLPGISPEIDRLNDKLAGLQTELDSQTSAYSDQTRVRRMTTASTKKSVEAAYLLQWQHHLETVGNRYYPQASVRYGIYGDLRMLVVIRQDGTLEDLQVLSSSGYAVLDEAAIEIVRIAAPYSPFSPELRATADKLEIVRTWHFRENALSSH